MVIDNVHYHANARIVQSHYHLLELVDPDLAVIGIGRIAALGHVVVLGIVAPVELRLGGGLVDRRVIVDRLQMYVRYAEVLQVVDADRLARGVLEAGLGEGEILALVLRALDLVGEVADVHLPDYRLVVGIDAVIEGIARPALGVSRRERKYHAAVAVDARRLRIGIDELARAGGSGHGIGIIIAVTHALDVEAPHALFAALHVAHLEGFAAVAARIEIDLYRAGRRRPEPELCAVGVRERAEFAVVGVFFNEVGRIEYLRGDRGLRLEALYLDGVDL